MKKYVYIGVLLGIVSSISGCSASGKAFTKFKTPTKDKGLVYVYRPELFTGTVVHYSVYNKETDKPVGVLYNKSYFSKSLPVGKYTLKTATNEIDITIDKNKIVCLKSYINMVSMVTYYTKFELEKIPLNICEKEIIGLNESI